MTYKEKIVLLEDILEADEGEITEDLALIDVIGWDSMAMLSLTAIMKAEFNKELTGAQIKAFKKIQDILNFME